MLRRLGHGDSAGSRVTRLDAYLGRTRGTVQLTGRFAIVGLGGIHRGYQSFGLCAMAIS